MEGRDFWSTFKAYVLENKTKQRWCKEDLNQWWRFISQNQNASTVFFLICKLPHYNYATDLFVLFLSSWIEDKKRRERIQYNKWLQLLPHDQVNIMTFFMYGNSILYNLWLSLNLDYSVFLAIMKHTTYLNLFRR